MRTARRNICAAALLQVVTRQEALARACAELLEGDWAQGVVSNQEHSAQPWPSQAADIAQALWVVENLGSVLVADAMGSAKTRSWRDEPYKSAGVRRTRL
jgi:hypothetical protein